MFVNENIKQNMFTSKGKANLISKLTAGQRAIGEIVLEQIYSQAPLISDPLLFDYTEHLIYRLSEYSQVNDRYFNVLLIDDSSLNAFAAPGGIIGVNGGLFLNADNEGQFASVIAHELAHLSQRHFARNVLKSQDSNLASALVMVSSIAIALISNNPNAISVGPAFLQQQNLRSVSYTHLTLPTNREV